jgi:hypothetical protein
MSGPARLPYVCLRHRRDLSPWASLRPPALVETRRLTKRYRTHGADPATHLRRVLLIHVEEMGHRASWDGPERSILYGRPNRGAETLRVFAGVTRAGITNERPSPASTSRAGHCAGRMMPKPPECGGDEPSARGHRTPLRLPSSPAGVLVRERDEFF